MNRETISPAAPSRRDTSHTASTVTAVVVNWGMPDYTIRSAQALIADGVPPERVVVVDNGSLDDSFERFGSRLPDCTLIQLDENIGFARASNVGARALGADAYLFVNNDAFVHRPGSVSAMLAALADASVGVVVPRLLNTDLTLQPNVVPGSSPGVELVRASGLSRFVPMRWQPRWSTHWSHDRSREIEAAIGAVVLVRRELWEALGGFEEHQLMYAEDLELCWRARKRGWRIWFARDAEFIHVGSAASAARWGDATRAELKGRAEAAMVRRHRPLVSSTLTVGLISLGLLARFAYMTVTRNGDAAAALRAAVRGYVAGFRAAKP